MKLLRYAGGLLLLAISPAYGVVFLNEIFINPQGSFDDTVEFIELAGTPGKLLDGYAIALLNGTENKYWAEGTARPADLEIDEFFSLDGLSIGNNGLLVIGIAPQGNYPTMVPDTGFHCWTGDPDTDPPQAALWNGGLDSPGKMQNDGSNTILLIRNRPGRSQMDPLNPDGLRWGKDVAHDQDFLPHVEDPQTPAPPYFDQWGDGSIDQGAAYGVCVGGDEAGMPCDNGCPGGNCHQVNTLDLRGSSTPGAETPAIDDDLEIVDEVSYEHGRGWEYDLDDRFVDCGVCQGGEMAGQPCRSNDNCSNGTCIGESQISGLPCRRVHALDDPQGFNADVLSRVDYRTKGPGWTTAPGAFGAYPPDAPAAIRNNWQDTATEQWIRGESVLGIDASFNFLWFYDHSANTNPDAIQPYLTNVPLWLNDGSSPDYDFTNVNTYEIKAGQINPLAIPFIPGDVNRDGICDTADIDRYAAVFGDDDWIFSNSYRLAPQGDRGDPAQQIRPWDMDATGDNGIEAGDLQWTLNFQGDTTGRIVGFEYDHHGASSTGVHLNPNTGVACQVTATAIVPSGRPLLALRVGDLIEMTVAAEIIAGANMTADQENGIMQYIHDIVIGTGGLIRVQSIEALNGFSTTRPDIQQPAGLRGDRGIRYINGYTTSFTQGLNATTLLYRVVFQATGMGGPVQVAVTPAAEGGLAASCPQGLKIGHTRKHGNPASTDYAAAMLTMTVVEPFPADLDGDGDVDQDDLSILLACGSGPEVGYFDGCEMGDLDHDGDVDQVDFGIIQGCISGQNIPVEPGCAPWGVSDFPAIAR